MKDKIFNAIKSVLFTLPFVFVGGKTLYTILNENAKDSFSDSVIEQTIYATRDTDYVNGRILSFYLNNNSGTNFSRYIGFSNISIDLQSLSHTTYEYNYVQIQTNGTFYFVEVVNDTVVHSFSLNISQQSFWLKSNGLFYLTNGSLVNLKYTVIYNTYKNNTIDNAFEYSLSKFNDLGFGKIDFLEWFNNLFLTDNFNNVYSTFINSYLNYFLFVELVMFIPSVFHWVIHFFTEIGNNSLSRSTNKEKGDD